METSKRKFRLTRRQGELRDLAASDATHILAYGGGRSGKTFAFCYCIAVRALSAPGSRHLIARRRQIAEDKIGAAERALELMVRRGLSREAFGKPLARLGKNTEVIAKARIELEACRLMVLRAAKAMDTMGNAEARVWVSAVKAMVPIRVCAIIDEAIQVFGATGVSQWTPLARMYAGQRTLRLADGPDEVHWHVVGRNEIARYEGEDNDTTRAARTQEGMFSGPA